MKISSTITRLAAQVILCLFIIGLQMVGAFTGLENLLTAKRSELAPRPATQQIVYVSIDRESLDRIGVWPWPRSVHADLIDTLVDADVSDIVFDVDFSNRSTPDEDQRLLNALRSAGGSVVLPTFVQQKSIHSDPDSPDFRTKPLEMFQSEAWIADVQVTPDSDGIVRTMQRSSRDNGVAVPSAASVLARQPSDSDGRFLIDFSIDPGTVPTYSVSDLLDGDIPERDLRDKSVMIGAHALELRDSFAVPVHTLVPGSMLQILAAETLMQDRALVPSSIWLTSALVLLVLAGSLLATAQTGLVVRLSLLAMIAVCIETAGFFLQKHEAITLSTVPAHVMVLAMAVFVMVTELNLLSLLVRLMRIENRNTRKVLGRVFADSSDGFLVVSKDGSVLEINDRFKTLFDGRDRWGSGQSVFELLPASITDDVKKAIARYDHQNNAAVTRSEYREILPEGQRVIEYSITPSAMTRDEQDETGSVFLTIAVRDVSLQRQQQAQLEFLSKHDFLTGALQRQEYAKLLSQHLVDLCAEGGIAVVCAINIRRLNSVNRTLGRRAGDKLLQAVAARLDRIGLPVSKAARLGSDTFVLHFTEDWSKSAIRHLTERLIRELSHPYDLDTMQLSVEFYAGVAETTDLLRQDSESLITNAELALASARMRGSGVAYFDPKDVAQQERALMIERDMRNGMSRGEFSVNYQPQVATEDGKPVGVEALLRWKHTELGMVSPGEFIEVAEASGFIADLGEWVLEKACRDACNWPDHITVAVNVSAKQFMRGSVVEDVQRALKASGLAAHRLEIEITESSFLHASEDLLVQLAELKKAGVSISLDDFGTGYSSFAYLAKFPVDKIKIDRMFLRQIADAAASQSVVRSVQVLAEGLGMKVLCEGVETIEQYEMVRAIGCAQIQGFYFGKPQSAEEITALIGAAGKPVLESAV
ncbi:MAG: EAL domain-containing protein [Pseudomonadota bacterium]